MEVEQGILLGIIIGLIFGVVISGWVYGWGNYDMIEELGKSICEEEYGMDYESYYNDVLRCKPFTETYDGIKVEVPKPVKELKEEYDDTR